MTALALERALLAVALIHGARAFGQLRGGRDNFTGANRRIFVAMAALVARGEPLDVVGVEAELRRRGSAVKGSDLTSIITEGVEASWVPRGIPLLEAALRKARKRSGAASAATCLIAAVHDPEADVDHAIAMAIGHLRRLRGRRTA